MPKLKDFYQLKTWKQSHTLVLQIYKITESFPQKEQYSLTDQIRRAASSITANIAEGFGRYHYPDKIRFFHQARGSIKELQSFLILAQDLKYIDKNTTKSIWELTKTSEKLINGLIRSTNKQKETTSK